MFKYISQTALYWPQEVMTTQTVLIKSCQILSQA